MNSAEHEIEITLDENGFIFASIAGVSYLALLFALGKKCDTWGALKRAVRCFPPLFAVLIAPLITYVLVCGAFSALTCAFIFQPSQTFEDPELARTNFLNAMRGIEYFCSFALTLAYCIFFSRIGLSSLWCLILALSHTVVAGYRTAKFNVGDNHFNSGPKVLEHFELLDGLVPIAALLVYLALNKFTSTHRLPND